MAGNYMDAPSDRVAYDRDGSVFSTIDNVNTVIGHPTTAMRAMNAEGGGGYQLPNNTGAFAVVFPIPMDVSAVFMYWQNTNGVNWQTSKDTTNGLDGTWTTQLTNAASPAALSPQYRQLAQLEQFSPSASTTEVRGIRASAGFSGATIRAFHVYAVPSATATKDRLVFWHPTSDVKLTPTYFDWGDVPRGTSEDRAFRIKNLSTNKIAKGTVLYIEAMVNVNPPTQGMFTLSDNGGSTFVTSLTLPDLAPGATSSVLVCRRVIPTNALVSVWTVRMIADVNTWL